MNREFPMTYHSSRHTRTEEKREEIGEKGYSLIEVMIGVFILAVGILSIFSMQLSGVRGNSVGRQYTEASTIAANQIEKLMALPYTDDLLKDWDGDGQSGGDKGLFDSTIGEADRYDTDPTGQYTIFWNIADNDVEEKTKTVSVVVIWNGGDMKRSVSIQMVVPEIT